MKKHPTPFFTKKAARQKIQMAEDAWNTKDPEKVSFAYSINAEWRNRDQLYKWQKKSTSLPYQQMEK